MGSEQVDTASDRAFENFEVAAESGNKEKAPRRRGDLQRRRRNRAAAIHREEWRRREMAEKEDAGWDSCWGEGKFSSTRRGRGGGEVETKASSRLSPSLLLKSNYNI